MVYDLTMFDSKIYLGTEGGIYYSTDSGNTWQFASESIPYRGLYHLVAGNERIISGSINGIYIKNTVSSNWMQPLSGMSSINGLAKTTTTIVAATEEDGIKLSTNGGLTWNSVSGTGNLVTSIGTHQNHVFADGNNSMYKSSDNGISFSSIPLTDVGLPAFSNVNSVSSVGDEIYLGMDNHGLYKSTDNGENFVPVNNGLPAAATISVEHVIKYGDILFAGIMGSSMPVYRSQDGGNTWEVSSAGMRYADGAGKFMVYNDIIFVSTTRGLYRSTDGGSNWTLSNNGITNGFVDAIVSNSSYVFCGLADRSQGGTQNIYRTADNGNTWEALNNGIGPVQVHSMFATDEYMLVAGNNQTLYRSTDNGNSWTNVGLSNSIGSDVVGFAKSGNTLFLISENNGPYKSNDNGLTWSPASTGNTVNPLGYAISSDGNSVFLASGIFTYQSDDMGLNWTNTGYISASTNGTALCAYGDYVLLGTRNNGIYRRLKTETSWTAVNNGISQPAWITSITAAGDSLFATTDYSSNIYSGNIYLSVDSGLTWTEFNDGLPEGIGVRAIHYANNRLWAGTGSLYNNDGRSVWMRLHESATSVNETNPQLHFIVYPNPNTGLFRISSDTVISNISLYNSSGQLIPTQTISSASGNIYIENHDLPPGIYSIVCESDSVFGTQKFIVTN